jgi:hypothetical protein
MAPWEIVNQLADSYILTPLPCPAHAANTGKL